MESSSTATRFQFRESENSNDSDSSNSNNDDHDSNLHSMTGMVIIEVFEEVKDKVKELMKLKTQVSTQKGLVKELIDGVYLKLLSEKTMESFIEEIDEAIAILEMEEENFKRLMVELGDIPSDALMLYKSAISDMKAMLTLESTLVAENSRISAPELQKALVGICRLGESHLATHGIHDLQNSKLFLHGVYIRELSRFVFSMISQAARSFMKLYGETSPFASEFIQWVYEEIEVVVVSCARYVISVSEVSSRLSTTVESVQFALSYCSLLETQRLVLRPCLIEHVRPCIKSSASLLQLIVIGERPEFCLLTSSGRNLVTVLQTITGDVTPLIALQLEDSILRGLMNLFSEYIAILEKPSPLKQMI
ncbi:exocyst complex component EXO84B [Salix suchowensis]|nr:exocyst complex component EXO84B [Salix suchowensis]